MKPFSSISFKFIFITILLVLVPSIYIGYQLINITRNTMEENIQEIHTKQVEAIKEKIDERIAGIYNIISAILRVKMTGNIDYERNMLSVLFRISNHILAVYTADNEGKVSLESQVSVNDFEIPVNISKDKLFQEAKNNQKITKGDMEYFNQNPGLRLIIPFANKFLIVIIDFEDISQRIKNTKIFGTGIIYMIDSNYNIVFHPDPAKEKNRQSIKDTKIAQQITGGQSSGATEYILDNKRMIGAYSNLEKFGFTIVSQQIRNEAYKSVIKMRTNAIQIIIASVLIAIIIGVFFARGLTRPILKITDVASAVAGGNYNVSVKVKTKDELNSLANTFNMMTRKIKEYTDMQIEKILLEKAKLEAILFSIADGVIMTDYSGNVLHLNESAKNMFQIAGYTNSENLNIYDLLQQKKIKEEIDELLKTKEKKFVKEIDLSNADISKYLKMVKNEVRSPKDDASLGLMIVAHDITLEKEIDKMKEDFLHSITHDLRTPMTSIRGFLEFLKDGTAGDLNEQQMKFINIIDRSSQKLLGMINDILDIAKLESGKMQIEIEDMNIEELIKKASEIFIPLAKDNLIEFSVKIEENLPLIQADGDLIERVLTNLIGNALKFTPKSGKITVETVKENNGIKVSVIDTGEGMPAEFLTKVFSKFQQSSAKHRRKGTGLGLTICKYVVEAHLGKIWVESEMGKGSTFIFWIPGNLKKSNEEKLSVS